MQMRGFYWCLTGRAECRKEREILRRAIVSERAITQEIFITKSLGAGSAEKLPTGRARKGIFKSRCSAENPARFGECLVLGAGGSLVSLSNKKGGVI